MTTTNGMYHGKFREFATIYVLVFILVVLAPGGVVWGDVKCAIIKLLLWHVSSGIIKLLTFNKSINFCNSYNT